MRLQGIIVFAKDFKSVLAFYRDGLGLTPVAEQPFDPRKFFQFEEGISIHSAGTPTGSKNKMVFEVESLREARERLVRYGKRVRKIEPFTGIDVFDVRDPEGNRVQVMGPYDP
ncbi:MAG: VOC family protein [Proteobacteria bacterium]|nr:VOC family protein [Pseudomonadota bacterium]